jgi:hypothetical protein
VLKDRSKKSCTKTKISEENAIGEWNTVIKTYTSNLTKNQKDLRSHDKNNPQLKQSLASQISALCSLHLEALSWTGR